MHTEIKILDLYPYMYGTRFVTMLILMSLFPRLKDISNVSYCLRNLTLNYNAFSYIISYSFNYRNTYFRNRAYDLFLYSVLINMDPVNKLYFFDWMILINTEYVVYSICVCVCVGIYVD